MKESKSPDFTPPPVRKIPPTLRELIQLGRILDRHPLSLRGTAVLPALASMLLRIRTREGRVLPLLPNEAQRVFESNRGQRNIVLKARQMGLTTWIAARFFLKTITQPGTLTLEVAHTQEAAEEIFRIVHRFLDLMPERLRGGPLRTSRESVRRLAFPALDAQYLVISAGERNAGRGLTVRNLHCSEVARWPGDPAETLAGLRAALAPDGEQILESTPNGVGDCFHQEWRCADEMGAIRHFFPWWMEPSYRAEPVPESSLKPEERELIRNSGLDLRQIGFRRALRLSFRGLSLQEYAEDSETCFLTSGAPVFELAAIEERMKTVPEPVERRHNGDLEIWLPPLMGKNYIVAVDPAGGADTGDYSAAQVLELESGLQCAEFRGHLGGLALAELVTRIAAEYNMAWLVIERNNHGAAILSLAEQVSNYPRIYDQKSGEGWLTTSVSRPAALGRLGAALVERPECFSSRRLFSECRSFVYLPNGRTGARAGTHDDCVMAAAIALSAREELLTSRRVH